MPRRRSNKRGIRGTRINFGVIFHAVLRAIEQQQQVPQLEIQVELNVTPEETDEEEALEPQQQQQEIDDQAAKPPDHNTTLIMCKYV
jgi:hypothetical protein